MKVLDFLNFSAIECLPALTLNILAARHIEVFLVYLSFVLLGFFFLFFLKNNLLLISEHIRLRYVSAAISGLIGLILTPIILLALFGTFIGIFLLPAFVIAYIILLLLAFYSAALLLGEFILRLLTFRDHIYLELALGTAVLFFGLFIPYAGSLLFLFFLLLGIGGVINMRFGTGN